MGRENVASQVPLMEREGKRASGVVSRMPTHGGDGYSYGGEWVVSIGGRAIVLGAEDERLSRLIAAAPTILEALKDAYSVLVKAGLNAEIDLGYIAEVIANAAPVLERKGP